MKGTYYELYGEKVFVILEKRRKYWIVIPQLAHLQKNTNLPLLALLYLLRLTQSVCFLSLAQYDFILYIIILAE